MTCEVCCSQHRTPPTVATDGISPVAGSLSVVSMLFSPDKTDGTSPVLPNCVRS